MLTIARSLPTTSESIEWVEASALDLPFPNGCFDLVLS
jgi:ubiquinone/menaquinone biosynthesis C-methylase UbiE